MSKERTKLVNTRVVAVCNQKGGVGKTSIVFNLAKAGAERGFKVLCIDLDGGDLSQYLTGNLQINEMTTGGIGDFLEGEKMVPLATADARISLLHGHAELDRYDHDQEVGDRALDPAYYCQLRGIYDFVFIDTPPAVGFRNLVSLVWADLLVIPMEPAFSSITAFQNLLKTIKNKITPLNPQLKWLGVINRAATSLRSHREKIAMLHDVYGSKMVATLTNRTAVGDAMDQDPAQPVWRRIHVKTNVKEEWHQFCDAILTEAEVS